MLRTATGSARTGEWRLLDCAPAWKGNGSSDAFIAQSWQEAGRPRILSAVNYSDHPSQCYVRLPFEGLGGGRWVLRDLPGGAPHERDGNELLSRGLYLDVGPWKGHLFEVNAR